MRIVSLLPSATEILCELGLIDQIVGISHDCDWPEEISKKPKLSEAKVSYDYPSDEIDQIIRETLHNGMSVYHLDPDHLKHLNPNVILTQELCEVCAPSFDDVQEAASVLDDEPKIISLEPKNIGEILENIELVGYELGFEDRAVSLVDSLRSRIDRIHTRMEAVDNFPRVLALEWMAPLFTGGHWVPEMIEWAGGETMGEPSEPSIEINWDDVVNFDPEIIVMMPCGFSPSRIQEEMHLMYEDPAWEDLRAVKHEQVYLVHGSHYFNRPGPRIVTGLEIMASIIHPELMSDMAVPEGAVFRWEDE